MNAGAHSAVPGGHRELPPLGNLPRGGAETTAEPPGLVTKGKELKSLPQSCVNCGITPPLQLLKFSTYKTSNRTPSVPTLATVGTVGTCMQGLGKTASVVPTAGLGA